MVAAFLMAGCAGPSLPLEVSMRKVPVDVILGAQPEQPAGAVVPGLPPSTAPGFIGAPVLLDLPPTSEGAFHEEPLPPRTPVTAPPVAEGETCATADPHAAAVEAAPTWMDAPKPGTYFFRREGTLRATLPGGSLDDLLAAEPQRLSTEVVRQVFAVEEWQTDDGSMRGSWNVLELSPGLRVTTSYMFEQSVIVAGDSPTVETSSGVSPGLYITRIVTEREDLPGSPLGPTPPGKESFEPAVPVKILDLPLAPQDPRSQLNGSGEPRRQEGTRDRSGSRMELFRYTKGRTNVDVCGTVIQGWEIAVSRLPDPHADLWSLFENPGVRKYDFGGSFVFAPQYGLIVEDNFQFGGAERTNHFEWGGSGEPQRRFRMDSHAVIKSVEPG